MTDDTLMQAAVLALTAQNVIRDDDARSAGVVGGCVLLASGWIYMVAPVYGEYSND